MKNASRRINKDVTVKNLDGSEREFKEGDKITTQVLSRREGICRLDDDPATYKCKAINGISKLSE